MFSNLKILYLQCNLFLNKSNVIGTCVVNLGECQLPDIHLLGTCEHEQHFCNVGILLHRNCDIVKIDGV